MALQESNKKQSWQANGSRTVDVLRVVTLAIVPVDRPMSAHFSVPAKQSSS
jgi:hypothetical protein